MLITVIKEDTKHKCYRCQQQSAVSYRINKLKTYMCDNCWCDIVLADFAKQWVMYDAEKNKHKNGSEKVS